MTQSEINILEDINFKTAVNSINRRAERQLDYDKLVDIYVETDLFTRTACTDTQLLLGRRGTGKTHMIRVFAQKQKLSGESVLYIDCTRLGSGIGSIRGMGDYEVAAKYFTSFLNQVSTDLLDFVFQMEAPDLQLQENLFTKLSVLANLIENDVRTGNPTFNYRQITDSVIQVLKGLQLKRLFILIDEWAQIPIKAQSYFAEFLKRAFLTIPNISVKLLAVNYQCEFYQTINGEHIGFQRGADVTDIVDFDTYLIYDEKRNQVVNFFGQVLYNHLGAELKWNLGVLANQKLASSISLFTQENAFVQLVRAAEGNCRDFLCIFARAYQDGFLRSRDSKKISIKNVESASASWFDAEKESNIKLEKPVYDALIHIFEKVIKGYKSRTFMIEASKSERPVITRLLNERVLHKLNIAYSHKDRPGVRFELYTLDFGAYVRFKGTENQPVDNFLFDNEDVDKLRGEEAKYIVPLDDKRSIRRIVFDPDTLQASSN